jgi:hypothetical protein
MHGYARAAPPARPHTPLHNMCRTVVDVAKRAVRQQYDVRTTACASDRSALGMRAPLTLVGSYEGFLRLKNHDF